jgi:hypothetical protein
MSCHQGETVVHINVPICIILDDQCRVDVLAQHPRPYIGMRAPAAQLRSAQPTARLWAGVRVYFFAVHLLYLQSVSASGKIERRVGKAAAYPMFKSELDIRRVGDQIHRILPICPTNSSGRVPPSQSPSTSKTPSRNCQSPEARRTN